MERGWSGQRGGRPRRLAVLLVVAALAGACSDGDPETTAAGNGDGAVASSTTSTTAAESADVAAVREAYQRYHAAVLEGDGATAAGLTSASTVEYYGRMQSLAVTGGPEEIQAEPMVNRLMVTILRHRIDPAQLASLSGAELIAYTFDQGMISRESVASTSIGRVEVAGEVAAAQVLEDGRPTSQRSQFVREDGGWRIDLVHTLDAANAALERLAAANGRDQNEIIFEQVEQATGQPVRDDILARPNP